MAVTFVLALVVGAAVGRWLAPARPSGAGVRLVPLVWLAAAVQLGVAALADGTRTSLADAGLLVTNVLVGAFLLANARGGRFAVAARIATVGWALNAAVIVANGAMPVSLHAAHAVGIEVDDVREGFLYEHENADASTALPFLADVIPIRLGPERSVQSIGDLILLLGITVASATATRREADDDIHHRPREEVNA